jgi:hypothetical protein
VTYVPKFRRAFKIDPKADLREIGVAVDAIHDAEKIAIDFLGNLDPEDQIAGFRIHALINLLGRVFEHTQAMLV